VNQVIWMKCYARPKMHVLTAPNKQSNVYACFQLALNQTVCFAHALSYLF